MIDAPSDCDPSPSDGAGDGFLVQQRKHNRANEIDVDDDHSNPPGNGVSSASPLLNWIDPRHDAAGNVTSGPAAEAETTRQHYVYDAWGRMVEVRADLGGVPGTLVARYTYDAMNWSCVGWTAATGPRRSSPTSRRGSCSRAAERVSFISGTPTLSGRRHRHPHP